MALYDGALALDIVPLDHLACGTNSIPGKEGPDDE